MQKMPMESLIELILLQLEKGGQANLTVTGNSMHPMLRAKKDSVTLVPANGNHKKGDVLLYRRENGQYVLHRVIGITEAGYICSGDNQVMREPVTQVQVLAKVSGFSRKGKYYCIEHAGYRIYTLLCVRLFFLRKPYLFIRRCAGRLCRRLFK